MSLILQEHKREWSRKKIARENYPLAKRIWEMEQAFTAAMEDDNHHMAQHYDYEIIKLYKKAGVSE